MDIYETRTKLYKFYFEYKTHILDSEPLTSNCLSQETMIKLNEEKDRLKVKHQSMLFQCFIYLKSFEKEDTTARLKGLYQDVITSSLSYFESFYASYPVSDYNSNEFDLCIYELNIELKDEYASI